MPYGFAIIGTGMISRFHARAIADVRGAKLVACFDQAKNYAEKFAAEHNCAAYDSLKKCSPTHKSTW